MADEDRSMRDLLIEIKTKLDMALDHLQDHEARIRSLEKTKWLMVGFAVAAGGLAGKITSFL